MKKKNKLTLAVLALAAGMLPVFLGAQSVATEVATDEMLSTGDYSTEGDSVATNRDAGGTYELQAQAGSHYLRFGGSFTATRSFTGWRNNAFVSGHAIRAGTYTASIDVGRGVVGDPPRDTYAELEFRLITVDREELPGRTVIEAYLVPPLREWTTVTVSYEVEPGSPLIGQPLSWSIDGVFSTSDVGKFGPLDNVVVLLEESSEWMFDFANFDAPFSLDFGEGQDTADGLLRSRVEDFTLQSDSLRYAPVLNSFASSVAFASVGNYQDRQDFSLEADVTLSSYEDVAANRFGFAVLGGPHDPPDNGFNAVDDQGFYGLVWVPTENAGSSVIQIREGFNGQVLAEEAWMGIRPFGDRIVAFSEDFEDTAAVEATWTRGGTPGGLWEFGEPTVGPDSAVSGTNVAGTNLDGFYGANANATLQTPVIDLSGYQLATLSFDEFTQVDDAVVGGIMWHNLTVSVVEPNGNLIVELAQYNDVSDWRSREFALPSEAVDREIAIEFRIVSDGEGGDLPGWYLDNVEVAAMSPHEPSSYTMQGAGVYDSGGILELSFSLTDENEFSQTVSTQIIDPFQGNLFGIGGRARVLENPAFDFHTFAVSLGGDPGEIDDPIVLSPFNFQFGSASEGHENFVRTPEADWSLEENSLRLSTASTELQNSLATSRVFNFEPGQNFLLALDATLTSLDVSQTADNRMGMVLFGASDEASFDPDVDESYYTMQWIPNAESGSSLVVRQGMDGTVIARTAFDNLDNPPVTPSAEDPGAGIGVAYRFEFYGFFNDGGGLDFIGVMSDGVGGIAIVPGSIGGELGNRFGFGARHSAQESPVWDFHQLTWQNNPAYEEPEAGVIARDWIGGTENYTTASDSGLTAVVTADGLMPTVGTGYINHRSASGVQDASTTLTDGFSSGWTVAAGTYSARIDVGRELLDPSREGYTSVEFRLVTLGGVEIGEAQVVEPYVAPAEGEWTTVRVSYKVDDESPLLGETMTWNVQVTQDNSEAGLSGALDNVVVRFVAAPTDVVATDEMLSTGDYTVVGSVAINRDASGNHGLQATAGSHYMRYGGSFTNNRSFTTRLTNGFVSGHVIEAGEYTASIDVGRNGAELGRDSFNNFEFRLVALDGTEIGARTVIEPYVPQPDFGQWVTVTISYVIEPGSPLIGETLTWSAEADFPDNDIAAFGPTDNVIVRLVPHDFTVATDEMLATGDYTVVGSVAINRDASGNHGLESTAGSHYMRYGGSFTEARSFTTRLTNGFVSGHVIEAGEYRASIDIGRNGEVLGRDSFDTFEFRLLTLDGTEIGERTVIQPYEGQPDFGQWTTVIIAYTIEPGDPLIGQTLTWGGEGAFAASSVGKFGPTDNVIVELRPSGSGVDPDGTTFAEWQTMHFGGQTDQSIIGPEATPAGDGIANLLKFALDPSDQSPMIPATTSEFMEHKIEEGKLQLSYWERKGANITYQPQFSSDMSGWGNDNIVETERIPDGDFDWVTIEADVPGDAPRAFLRITVSEN